jgi:arylsulfatase A-like enzyme
MRTLLALCLLAGLRHAEAAPAAQAGSVQGADPRPNILWFIVDDMSANFSCYGEKAIETPNVDRLAREGTRFSRAFITAPVCSPCRSALITGMYQTSIGAQQHRSGRGELKIRLPDGVEPVPAIFKRAGYWTAIGGWPAKGPQGKTDYNFEWPKEMYDGVDWAGRKPGQPFFMQVQVAGGKLRHGKGWPERAKALLGSNVRPEDVVLPPYYPRDPVLLQDWAEYLDTCRATDLQLGQVVERLKAEGLLEKTIVFFMTDHGISHARGKQFLYDEGMHVPLVARGPGIPAGATRSELVSHIDLTATSLRLAGIPLPASMQGRPLFGDDVRPRDVVFAARDRCDETVERMRAVRTDRWKYIRNWHPKRPALQPNAYKDAKPIVRRLRELHEQGKLDELQERLLFAPERAPEELYDLQADPRELRNLAADPAHASTLADLRGRLDAWMKDSGDRGAESEAMYDSDMAVYLAEKRDPARRAELEATIALMKRWAREGK